MFIYIQIILLVTYALISAIGLTLLKYFPLLSSKGMIGLFLYGLGFLFWITYIIKQMPLSLAFPIASGMIVIMLLVITFFVERIFYWSQFFGALIIIIGICIIYLFPESKLNT